MTTLFDKTRGIKGRIKYMICEHGVTKIDNYEETGNHCEKCNPKSERSFYIPDTKPFFNQGLGCVTEGTRHAEKIAKRKGLTPIADVPLRKVAKSVWPNHPLTRSLNT